MKTITICIPTFGNSQLRLYNLLNRIRTLSGVDDNYYEIAVSDDGTPNPIINKYKELICDDFGAKYITCPSPNGVCQNINYLIKNIDTEYLFFIEDGNLVTKDFLKPAFNLIEKWDNLIIDGYKPGLMGWSFIELWELLTIPEYNVCNLNPFDVAHNINFNETRKFFYFNNSEYIPNNISRIDVERKIISNIVCSLVYKKYDQAQSFLKSNTTFLSTMGRWGEPIHDLELPFWEDILWPVRWTWSSFITKKSIIEEIGYIDPLALPFEGWLGAKIWESNRYCAFVPSPPMIHLKNQCFQDLDQYYPEEKSKIIPRYMVKYLFNKHFGMDVDDLCLFLEDKYITNKFLLTAKEVGLKNEL